MDNPNVGTLIHQATSRKRPHTSGNPELADWGVYVVEHYIPGDPMSFTDCKLADLEHASRTSICHSMNGVQCCRNVNDWPVQVSIPSIPDMTTLELHIPVNRAMWYLPVVKSTLWDKALLCAFFYAVHSLIATKVTLRDPYPFSMDDKKIKNHSKKISELSNLYQNRGQNLHLASDCH